MQHRMSKGDLLDSRGRLIERGWASAEVRRYDRKAIRASGWRIKEWDYYCIATDRHVLALTVDGNAPSWGLMLRLGMERRADLDFASEEFDPASGRIIVYGLARQAWELRR